MASRSIGSEPRVAHKGQQTKATIIDAALRLATQIGLEGLSIGALAEVAHMSKSGVFAHFGSRSRGRTYRLLPFKRFLRARVVFRPRQVGVIL